MKIIQGLLYLLLVGCSVTPNNIAINQEVNIKAEQIVKSSGSAGTVYEPYYQKPLIKNVNDYAKWLTQDLLSNLHFPGEAGSFIVTNFSLLDSDLQVTNHFGRQMTEAMMHEVSRSGFTVIDMKTTDFLRINEMGDVFFHSEDSLELRESLDAKLLVAGTMTKHRGGYLVNARVLDIENAFLLTSAQIFIPHDVIDSVLLETQSNSGPQQIKVNRIKLKASVIK